MKKIMKILLCVSLLIMIVLILIMLKKSGSEKPAVIDWSEIESDITETTETTQAVETEEETTTETEQETQAVIYPEPDYDFREEEVTVEIDGLSRAYKLAWVSDLHMITDFEVSWDVKEEFLDDIALRDSVFVTDDGVRSAALWQEVVKFLNYGDFDGIIFGGDMMDYCSESNLKAFREEFNKLNESVPIMYIRADHDYGYWYGGDSFTEPDAHEVHKEIDGDDLDRKYLDFGEFMVVGVNGSTLNMPQGQYDIINGQYNSGKPVIAVTHVPYASKIDKSLEELSMEVRNKVYYWDYDATDGDYVPDDVTKKYLDMIYADDTPVCQVLAGHLHAQWDGMLTEYVPQHIFSPAYQGCIGIINVVPERKEQ